MRSKAIELFLAVSLAGSLVACGNASSPPDATNAESPTPVAEAPEGGESGEGGEGETTTDLKWGGKFSDRAVMVNFADRVVLPKYQEFATTSTALSQALETFASNPSAETLDAARKAWSESRAAWEKTESFAFGPAGSLGYDGALDTWPINETDIQKILSSSDPLTPEAVAGMQDSQKGMHAIEYLLFGLNNDKTLEQFSDREREYLKALGADLATVATALLDSWQNGVEGQPAYREVLANAGETDNSTYPTLPAGAQEMVAGIIDCLNEVAAEKLGVPLQEKETKNLESRFSFNTLNDLKNNIAGAQNVYLGTLSETANQPEESLSAYIAQSDPSLDTQIKTEFQEALAALDQIPAPLEKSITDSNAETTLKAAQDAIVKLQQTLEQKLVPLI